MRYKDWPKDAENMVESLRAELAAERQKTALAELSNDVFAVTERYEDLLAAEREKVRELEARLARQKESLFDHIETNISLRQQLAAAQLENQRLRDALEHCYRYDSHDDQWYFDEALREEALAAPTETAALAAYVEPWKKDAERYRWLRDNKHLDIWWSVEGPQNRCDNIDADIDAAIATQDPKA